MSKCNLIENELDEDEICMDDIKASNENPNGEEFGLQNMFASVDQDVTIRLIQYVSKD